MTAQLAPGFEAVHDKLKLVPVTADAFKPVGIEGRVAQTGADDEDDLIEEEAEVVAIDDEDDLIEDELEVLTADEDDLDVLTDDDVTPR